jgi:hypothetical protein
MPNMLRKVQRAGIDVVVAPTASRTPSIVCMVFTGPPP